VDEIPIARERKKGTPPQKLGKWRKKEKKLNASHSNKNMGVLPGEEEKESTTFSRLGEIGKKKVINYYFELERKKKRKKETIIVSFDWKEEKGGGVGKPRKKRRADVEKGKKKGKKKRA